MKNVLGFIWCLPTSLLAGIFILCLYFFKQFEKVSMQKDLSIIWDVRNDSWLYKRFGTWFGFTAGCHVVLIDVGEKYDRCFKHEKAHVKQNYIFGVFFFPLYILHSIYIYMTDVSKSPYLDNYFEIMARKEAGQPIEIPRENWSDEDGNPWW